MKICITADLHLDNRPQHEYRWQVLEYILKDAAENHATEEFWILGDLIDRSADTGKDHFLARLEGILQNHKVQILTGNHDPVQELRELESDTVQIHHPDGHSPEFIPYGNIPQVHPALDLACTHQPVSGAFTGTVFADFDDLPLRESFAQVRTVISGDVHTPQSLVLDNTIGTHWIYVGAPVHTDFGRSYEPRYLVRDTESQLLLPVPIPPEISPRRRILDPKDRLASLDRRDHYQVPDGFPQERLMAILNRGVTLFDSDHEIWEPVAVHPFDLEIAKIRFLADADQRIVEGLQQDCGISREKLAEMLEIPEDILRQIGSDLHLPNREFQDRLDRLAGIASMLRRVTPNVAEFIRNTRIGDDTLLHLMQNNPVEAYDKVLTLKENPS